jgi:hypothetical protein
MACVSTYIVVLWQRIPLIFVLRDCKNSQNFSIPVYI